MVRINRVSISSGLLGRKFLEGGAPQIMSYDDENVIISPAEVTIHFSSISAFSLTASPFKEGCLSLEARFATLGRTRQYIQLFFPNSELPEIEELLSRRGIRRKPEISSVTLDFPLSRFYAPSVRKAIAIFGQVYPIIIISATILELYIRFNKGESDFFSPSLDLSSPRTRKRPESRQVECRHATPHHGCTQCTLFRDASVGDRHCCDRFDPAPSAPVVLLDGHRHRRVRPPDHHGHPLRLGHLRQLLARRVTAPWHLRHSPRNPWNHQASRHVPSISLEGRNLKTKEDMKNWLVQLKG